MNVVRFDSIDSTNEEARRRAAAGETGPLWIVARVQTAGRGRRGRTWVSQPGNLFASLLLTPPGSVEQRAQLSFVAALAVAETIDDFADAVALKWPNDVLLDRLKVAGVLLESLGPALVVGFGINLADYPDDSEFPATCIGQKSPGTPDVEDAFPRLARRWNAWYDVWHRGFAPIRAAWLARASGLGEKIRVRLMDRELTGVFEDLDADGALLLRHGGALTRVTAGDVFFGE